MKTNKILIIDLEATCWENAPPEYVHENSEIIEIGLCLYDTTKKEIIKNQGVLVKPEKSEISKFCTNLTSITSNMVKDSPTLKEALDSIKKEYNPRNYTWGSWGYYDLKQLSRETKRKGIKNIFPDQNHINLKTMTALSLGLPKGVGINKALTLLNLTFDGRPHRGVDDTLNIARIIQRL